MQKQTPCDSHLTPSISYAGEPASKITYVATGGIGGPQNAPSEIIFILDGREALRIKPGGKFIFQNADDAARALVEALSRIYGRDFLMEPETNG